MVHSTKTAISDLYCQDNFPVVIVSLFLGEKANLNKKVSWS